MSADPGIQRQEALLEKLKRANGQNLSGLALSTLLGDDQATRLLSQYILQQQKQPVPPRAEFERLGIKTFADRFNLLVQYARADEGNHTPLHLREMFSDAVCNTLEIADAAAGEYVVASPDAHHFAATRREDGGYDIATKSLVYAPPEIHYATLLMNPVNPLVDGPNGENAILTLSPGRMERQARVISEETGIHPLRLLRGVAANAMHLAAWRYDTEVKGQPLHPSQMSKEYFLEVADQALSLT